MYSWQPATGLSSATAPNPIAYISAPVQYIATATDNQGCRARDTIQIAAINKPVVDLGTDMQICNNESITLDAGNAGASFLWNTGSTAQTYLVTSAGLYSVQVSKDGCTSRDSVNVSIRSNAAFDLQPQAVVLCKNDSLVLGASGGDIYEWFTASRSLNVTTSIYRGTAQESETYFVKITDAVCGSVDTLSATLVAKPLPLPVLTKSNDIDCSQSSAQLSVAGGQSYQWMPTPGLSNLSSAAPSVTPTVSTIYTVKVTGANNCVATDSIRVFVDYSNAGNVYVPNAFTPNQDGKNDCFGVKLGSPIQSYKLSIYNRWGEVVFQTASAADCWNGYYKGVLQPTGVFVYIVSVDGQCGKEFKRGTFALIR